MEQYKELLYSALFQSDIGTLVPHVPALLAEGGTGADLSAEGPGLLQQTSAGAVVTVSDTVLRAVTIQPAANVTPLNVTQTTAFTPSVIWNVGANEAARLVLDRGAGVGAHGTILLGYNAGAALTDPWYAVGLGSQVFAAGTTGLNGSIAIGYRAGYSHHGTDDVLIGFDAGYQETEGQENVAIGLRAMYGVAGGIFASSNVAIGSFAMENAKDGELNVFIGDSAGQGGITGVEGDNNMGLGALALQSLTTGLRNVALGSGAGQTLTTGDRNILIGYYADAPTAITDDYLNIGGLITGSLAAPKSVTVDGTVTATSFIGPTTAITVADESADTTCFPLFVTAATGDLGPKTNAGFLFNSSTGALGIGVAPAAGKLHLYLSDAATTGQSEIARYEHISTGSTSSLASSPLFGSYVSHWLEGYGGAQTEACREYIFWNSNHAAYGSRTTYQIKIRDEAGTFLSAFKADAGASGQMNFACAGGTATGPYAVAIGKATVSVADYGVMISGGFGSNTLSSGAAVVGGRNNAVSNTSVGLLGSYSTLSGSVSIGIGDWIQSTNTKSIVIGYGDGSGDYLASVGNNTIIMGQWTALTSTINDTLNVAHNSTGTPAAGFGTALNFKLKTTTTKTTQASAVKAWWSTATHASRVAVMAAYASDSAGEYELWRGSGAGGVANLGFFGVAAVVRPTALTTALTTVTCTAPGTPDYAIADLAAGGYGFVAADEGQSVLKVIANLQTRVGELETKLQALGLLT